MKLKLINEIDNRLQKLLNSKDASDNLNKIMKFYQNNPPDLTGIKIIKRFKENEGIPIKITFGWEDELPENERLKKCLDLLTSSGVTVLGYKIENQEDNFMILTILVTPNFVEHLVRIESAYIDDIDQSLWIVINI